MRKRPNEKARRSSGFTLSETLVAIIILLLVTSTVAVGIPMASNAYEKIVVSANAEVLLSTTMTCLRDELCTATDVTLDGTTINYTSSNGSKSRIYLDADGEGICIREYIGVSDSADFDHPLVSKEASNKNLHMTYTVESYTGGVIRFKDLTVLKGDSTVTELEYFEVRVLADLT